MTEDDLFDDLCRLVRLGLVYVPNPEDPNPRFALTARGLERSSNARLFPDKNRWKKAQHVAAKVVWTGDL